MCLKTPQKSMVDSHLPLYIRDFWSTYPPPAPFLDNFQPILLRDQGEEACQLQGQTGWDAEHLPEICGSQELGETSSPSFRLVAGWGWGVAGDDWLCSWEINELAQGKIHWAVFPATLQVDVSNRWRLQGRVQPLQWGRCECLAKRCWMVGRTVFWFVFLWFLYTW